MIHIKSGLLGMGLINVCVCYRLLTETALDWTLALTPLRSFIIATKFINSYLPAHFGMLLESISNESKFIVNSAKRAQLHELVGGINKRVWS